MMERNKEQTILLRSFLVTGNRKGATGRQDVGTDKGFFSTQQLLPLFIRIPSVNLENSAVATELAKVTFHSNPKEGQSKECSNYCTITLILHASKVMLKILQARLQQYMNPELPDVQAGFRKGRRTRDQIANIHWIQKRQENSKKPFTSALLTMLKPLCGS